MFNSARRSASVNGVPSKSDGHTTSFNDSVSLRKHLRSDRERNNARRECSSMSAWRQQAPRLRGASTQAWARAVGGGHEQTRTLRGTMREFCLRARRSSNLGMSCEVALVMSLSEDCGATSCLPRRRPALRQADRNRPLWRPAVLPKSAEWRGEAARPCEQTWSTACRRSAPATSGRWTERKRTPVAIKGERRA